MIRFPKRLVPNRRLDQTLGRVLGEYWLIEQSESDWIVGPKLDAPPLKYFEDVTRTSVERDRSLPYALDVLGRIESAADHQLFIEASGLRRLDHFEHAAFGATAWLHVNKTMLFFKPHGQLDPEFSTFMSQLRERFSVREALVFRRNQMPFAAILSFRKFAYLLPELGIDALAGIETNAFWGVLPHPFDFGTYLDPFLVFMPNILCLPFDRPASGIICIPERSILLPYEGNACVADMLLSAPGTLVQDGGFGVFGGDGQLSKIFIRRFATTTMEHLNGFLEWLCNPQSSFDGSGVYSPSFGLQLLASVHSAFCSFIYSARRIQADERIWHCFGVLDRLANLATSFAIFRPNIRVNAAVGAPSIEAARFQRFFSNDFFEACSQRFVQNFDDSHIARIICGGASEALAEINASVSQCGPDSGRTIRTIRNLTHGAFLRNEAVLTTFRNSEARLSPKLPVLVHFYMLCLVVDPEFFLERLGMD